MEIMEFFGKVAAMRYRLVFVLLLIGSACYAGTGVDLRVSDNGRFLVHSDGSKFFPLADTAWSLAWQLDRGDVVKYLKRRHEQKFNTIAMVAFPSYDKHKSIAANVYGDKPFALNAGRWNPLQPVRISARLGVQMGFAQMARVKVSPLLTR